MINVLINAYACSPTWGSEPGMAWNWIVNIAKYCNVFVITEGEWKNDIEEATSKLSYHDHLTFYYIPVSEKVRNMCWNQGDWRFYYFYRQWQKKALHLGRQICKQNHIDIIHQLNMVGFREPGLLWRIKGYKFIWGPIGGMDNIPIAYLKGASLKQKIFCIVKNFINTCQYRFQPNVRYAIKSSSVLISAVKGVETVLSKYYSKSSYLINETGCHIDSTMPTRPRIDDRDEFHIIWVGKFDFRKQLGLALEIINKVSDLNIKFHICGTGSQQQTSYYQQLANKLDISDKCIWHGKVPHDQIQHLLSQSDVFLFTSIMEATSTVVLEAISSGLPILCFNTCGFGPLVNDNIGRKVEITNPKKSVDDFEKHIRYLYQHRDLINEMSKNEINYRVQLSWEEKAKQMIQIYKNIL